MAYLEILDGSNNKARVLNENGVSILYSYETKIMRENADGSYDRLWDGWSATTGKHIKLFAGLNKKEFLALELKNS